MESAGAGIRVKGGAGVFAIDGSARGPWRPRRVRGAREGSVAPARPGRAVSGPKILAGDGGSGTCEIAKGSLPFVFFCTSRDCSLLGLASGQNILLLL